MTRRVPSTEHAPARYSDETVLPRTHPSSDRAGPSRQPLDSRKGSGHGWGAHPPRSPDSALRTEAWIAGYRDVPRPLEVFSRSRPISDVPTTPPAYGFGPAYTATASVMAPTAPMMQSRLTSAEEWQKYADEPSIPRNAQLPPMGTSPASALPPSLATPTGDADPPRARVACTFCRARKLRCDGATPCRHCERRSIDCAYPANKSKAKSSARDPSSPGKSNQPLVASIDSSNAKQLDGSHQGADRRERGTKRAELSSKISTSEGLHSALLTGQKSASKRLKTSNGQSHPAASEDRSESNLDKGSPTGSTPSSSMPGSDLAMIQNNDSPIPMDPTFGGQDEWWDHLLGMLSRSRATSIRIVQSLLTRFVQSNAVFFGLLHAPTLLSVVSARSGHSHADPALYLAVLAVSACDMHQHRIADERTSDMRSANEASRQLATRLSDMAANYLQTSTAHGSTLTPSMGQAASILALTQPDGSTEQTSLIRLAENVVRSLKLHEQVSSREPLLQDSEPDSPLYWSRPLTSDSPESEVKYESIVRLCWTGISHRFRKYIAKPDDDFGDTDLPEYIQEIRPMAFWQPSLLPEDLPPPFFHSQDLMRRSAHLSRLTVSLAQLDKLKEVEESDAPSPKTLDKVRGILRSLDNLETAFVRHRPRSEAERQNVLGRTLQMFCRMHVWVRLTIWRKYRLWSSPADPPSAEVAQSVEGQTQEAALPQQRHDALFQQLHPTVEFWLSIVQEMIITMQQDLDGHVVDPAALQTSASDVDALVRHVICACDLVEASGKSQPILATVEEALSVLKRVLAFAALHDETRGLQITDDVADKVKTSEARLAGLQLLAEADTPELDVAANPTADDKPSSGATPVPATTHLDTSSPSVAANNIELTSRTEPVET